MPLQAPEEMSKVPPEAAAAKAEPLSSAEAMEEAANRVRGKFFI
jgi:hypothetical protein